MICELGHKVNHKEYKGGLMGDNNLKINVLRKAIALLQRDVRNEEFSTSTSTGNSRSRGRTISNTMNSMVSWAGFGQRQSPDGYKHEAAV